MATSHYFHKFSASIAFVRINLHSSLCAILFHKIINHLIQDKESLYLPVKDLRTGSNTLWLTANKMWKKLRVITLQSRYHV